ncbi:MAG: secretin N-terminal domain-containing protein [Bdellovibrionales bacterium]
MKLFIQILLSSFLAMSVVSCSSTEEKSLEQTEETLDDDFGVDEEGDDLADEDFGDDDISDDEFASDTEEGEESFEDEESLAQEDSSEESFEQNDDLQEESFAETDIATEENSSADESVAFEDTSTENVAEPISVEPEIEQGASIVGLDFLANQNGGTVVISSNQEVSFRKRKNLSTGQFVIEMEDVNLPQKFQRPYDTREFNGAVGIFQAYQEPGSRTARIVIQLTDDSEPLVQQEGNSLLIVASAPQDQKDDFIEEMKLIYGDAVDSKKIRDDKEVLKDKTIEDFVSGNTNFYGRKINIEVKNANIRDVFDFIAEQSGLNIVIAEDVQGAISLKLRQIPWDQALMVVLQSKQLGYVKSGNILRIAPLSRIESESNEARRVIEAQRRLQPLKVRVFPISFAEASELIGQITDFLTPSRGSAKADTRTNQIIVTDIPEVLKRISDLIRTLDTETPQVLMEAKFVEATESFEKDFNLSLGSTADGTGNASLKTGASSGTAGIISTIIDPNFGNISAFLNLYESKNLAKVISAPRVVGLNNETATISQTTQVTDVSTTFDSEANSTTTSIETKDLNLSLSITPQITADGGVLMDITIDRDVALAQVVSGDVTATPIGKRSAKTKVLVPNGETVVLGGIYQIDNTEVTAEVSLLSKIPIIGEIFTHKTSDRQKNELMIFITPRVLNVEKAFNRSQGYVEELTKGSKEDSDTL